MITSRTWIWILLPGICSAIPPYTGTIFMDPDILTQANTSALSSTRYLSRRTVNMFDRRVNAFLNVDAYTFEVKWSDHLQSVAVVNTEFGSLENAAMQAEKYAFRIGQLPAALRVDIDEIWIHKGLQPFGGGNRSILIHTEQADLYETQGIMEETLVHEACHTSLDSKHSNSPGWNNAQSLDNEYISDYAQDNPSREDVAESFLPWLAVNFRKDAISAADYAIITQSIPNRLRYFDSLQMDMYPILQKPTSSQSRRRAKVADLHLSANNWFGRTTTKIFDASGRNRIKPNTPMISRKSGTHLPPTAHFAKPE